MPWSEKLWWPTNITYYQRQKKTILQQGAKPLSIIKNILKKITEDNLLFITNFNVDTSFKVAWANFIRMRKLIIVEVKKMTFAKSGLSN